MVKRLIAVSTFALALGVAVGYAQQDPAPEQSKAPSADTQAQGLAAPKTEHVMGTISKVDAINNSLTLKKSDNNQEQSFTLDSAAKVTLDGKSATLADLKAGQKVTVQADSSKATSVSASTASGS